MTPKSEGLALASCSPPQHQAVAANVANVPQHSRTTTSLRPTVKGYSLKPFSISLALSSSEDISQILFLRPL